jgi:PAS domain S-box-containing protein
MAISATLDMQSGPSNPPTNRPALNLAAGLLALAIFLVDMLTPLEGAVAVLYVVVVLIAAKLSRRALMVAVAGCIILTSLAYLSSHSLDEFDSPMLRAAVSIAAISSVTFLALRNRQASEKLLAQARLLDLSHDMIFVRDALGVITFWSRGAEASYGWTEREAIGAKADDLLRTRYPSDRERIEADFFRDGQWEGVVRQRTRDGSEILVESRWALHRDEQGRPLAALETHRDVTEREASHIALSQSERRYRRIFDASRAGLLLQDWSGVRAELIEFEQNGARDLASQVARCPEFVERLRSLVKVTDVNASMMALIGASGVPGFPDSLRDILGDADKTFADSVLAFARGDRFFEGETEVRTLDGGRVPVLFGLTFPDEDDGSDREVLVFVVDVTERDRAQGVLLAAQADLARAARVATLGELTASIAHEVNQPLASIVTSGEAALRWLRRDEPDLDEVSSALTRTVAEGKRAGAVVARIRSFLTKGEMRRERLRPAELIQDAVLLVEHELGRNGVALRVETAPDLPEILADRVQMQQVLVNLMVNGAQAMASMAGDRRLSLRAGREVGGQLTIAVTDTGPGIADDHLARLFEPFFTTRSDGMGMGLAICRSTVEAHGGRLTARSRPGEGATFLFTIPTAEGGSP